MTNYELRDCPRCGHCCPKSNQEPVAWRYRGNLHEFDPSDWAEGPVTPLYTTPQPKQEHTGFIDSKLNPIKRQWVGLTDEEIMDCTHHLAKSENETWIVTDSGLFEFAHILEEMLKRKNT